MIYFITNPEDYNGMKPSVFDNAVSSMYNNLSIFQNSSVNLLMKCESRYGPSDKHIEKCRAVLGRTMKTINAKEDRLLQVNNLISGIVYSFLQENHSRNKNKVEINNYFNERYKLSEKLRNDEISLPSIKIQKVRISQLAAARFSPGYCRGFLRKNVILRYHNWRQPDSALAIVGAFFYFSPSHQHLIHLSIQLM